MNNDKITDEEIDALDDVDLIELGQNFLDNGDGQRALKCFLRAAEPDKSRIEKIIGLSTAAEIYRDGLGGVPVDGHKALKYYKRIVKLVFGTLDIHSLDADEKFKRIRADGEVDHLYAVRALADIANIYGNGEAGIRPNPRKAEKFFDLATYLDHEYLADEDSRSWRRNEHDEQIFD